MKGIQLTSIKSNQQNHYRNNKFNFKRRLHNEFHPRRCVTPFTQNRRKIIARPLLYKHLLLLQCPECSSEQDKCLPKSCERVGDGFDVVEEGNEIEYFADALEHFDCFGKGNGCQMDRDEAQIRIHLDLRECLIAKICEWNMTPKCLYISKDQFVKNGIELTLYPGVQDVGKPSLKLVLGDGQTIYPSKDKQIFIASRVESESDGEKDAFKVKVETSTQTLVALGCEEITETETEDILSHSIMYSLRLPCDSQKSRSETIEELPFDELALSSDCSENAFPITEDQIDEGSVINKNVRNNSTVQSLSLDCDIKAVNGVIENVKEFEELNESIELPSVDLSPPPHTLDSPTITEPVEPISICSFDDSSKIIPVGHSFKSQPQVGSDATSRQISGKIMLSCYNEEFPIEKTEAKIILSNERNDDKDFSISRRRDYSPINKDNTANTTDIISSIETSLAPLKSATTNLESITEAEQDATENENSLKPSGSASSYPESIDSSESHERQLTSVSGALKVMEIALKPIRDQLSEIRTKMFGLPLAPIEVNDINFPLSNESAVIIKEMDENCLTSQDNSRNEFISSFSNRGWNQIDISGNGNQMNFDETSKYPSNRMNYYCNRFQLASIWTEPEDILGEIGVVSSLPPNSNNK